MAQLYNVLIALWHSHDNRQEIDPVAASFAPSGRSRLFGGFPGLKP